EIGVLDTIAANGKDAWFSSSEIAFGLPTKPTNPEAPMLLDRMLRLLVSHSVLKCLEAGENNLTGKIQMVYAVEPFCTIFLKHGHDESGSLMSLFMVQHRHVYFETWYVFYYLKIGMPMLIIHTFSNIVDIVVDIVTPIEPKHGDLLSNIFFSMDMLMLTHCSGCKERSFSQFEALAIASGFLNCELICIAFSHCVIEFHK
ncbi:unnamed protein product, partial [Brassica oleracea]